MQIKVKRFFRYCGLAAAILFFLWIAALTAVYFFIDVNKVKKAALTYVNQNTRGELDVGDVKLKLFPIVHFEVKDIVFKSSQDFQRKDLFRCTRADLSFGIWSLIFGKPNIELYLEAPYVDFVSKNKDVNNVSDLVIKKEATASAGSKDVVEKKSDGTSYLYMSRFTFDVKDAEVKYTSPKAKYDIRSLSFKLMMDPAEKSIELKAGSPLDIKDKKFFVNGSWRTNIEVKPKRDDTFDIKVMLDATKLGYGSTSFVKPKGLPLKIDITANGNEDVLNINKAVLTLAEPWISITGKVSSLKQESSPVVLKVESSAIDAGVLKKLIPLLKDYELSGNIYPKINVSGTLQKLLLDAELDATKTKIKSAAFVKLPGDILKLRTALTKTKEYLEVRSLDVWLMDEIVNASGKVTDLGSEHPSVQFSAKRIELDLAKLSRFVPAIKNSKLNGSIKGTAEVSSKIDPVPYLRLDVKYYDPTTKNDLTARFSNSPKNTSSILLDASSTYLNLNTLVPNHKKPSSGGNSSSSPAQPIDKKKELITKEQVKSLNDLLSKYSIAMNVNVNRVMYKELTFSNLVFQAKGSNGDFSVNKFRADTLGGILSSGLSLSTNIAKPSYNAIFEASGLKVKEAVLTLMPDLRGVIDGVLSGKISVAASGYTVGDVQKSLTGKGDFAFNNFVYSSKELNEVINQKLTEKLGKFSTMQGKNIFGGNPGWETVQGLFNIKDEKINIEKLLAKEKEYSAEGKGHIDFNKYMDMDLMVTVPYRNIPYEPFKVEKKDLSTLPVHLTGPVAKPKFDGAKLLQYFLDRTVEFEKKKLKEKADKELQKVKAQAGDKIKQALKGLKF